MNLALFLSLLSLSAALPASAPPKAGPCLKYEPEIVVLAGTMKRHNFPGPPNYESVRNGDALEVYWLLHLAKPVCVESLTQQERVNEPETGVSSIQILISGYGQYRHLLGKRVKVTGTLFHQITGHHHTKVLINASNIEPAP